MLRSATLLYSSIHFSMMCLIFFQEAGYSCCAKMGGFHAIDIGYDFDGGPYKDYFKEADKNHPWASIPYRWFIFTCGEAVRS